MNNKKSKFRVSIPNDTIGLIIALAVIVIIFSMLNEHYLSSANIMNILIASSLTGLVAIGESYLIIAGLVDLSAGSVAAFASVLAAVLLAKGFPFIPTVIIVVFSGIIVGYTNDIGNK